MTIKLSKSICLLSGGLDSCVAAAIAREDTEVLMCLTVAYGQKHVREIKAAEEIAKFWKLRWEFIPLRHFGRLLAELHASALVDPGEALPTDRRQSEMTARVPRSYVPGRNTILLALAQSVGEALDVDFIYCGFNAVDFSGYPDCRPIFVQCWNGLARVATKRGYENNPIDLVAPIINSSKASVVRQGADLGAPLHLTWSCYAGGDRPCGRCDSCIIRYAAFRECGLTDPAGPYEHEPEWVAS